MLRCAARFFMGCAMPSVPKRFIPLAAERHKGSRSAVPNANARSSSALGYGRTWQRLRRLVLSASPMCVAIGCDAIANEVDHIIPKKNGGTDAMDNLQTLCKSCHSAKTWRENN